uniref:Uncharacterized protein n=1 Tax=Anopheles quadriannulatus TaxID=34691 RepID=A0A182XQA9_ANOQN
PGRRTTEPAATRRSWWPEERRKRWSWPLERHRTELAATRLGGQRSGVRDGLGHWSGIGQSWLRHVG